MSLRTRPWVLAAAVSSVLVGCCRAGGCNNDNFANHGIINAAARFQLVIQGEPTPARLLLDSVTGDLWQLRDEPAGGARWVRVASGPVDARALTPQEVLGARAPRTPTP